MPVFTLTSVSNQSRPTFTVREQSILVQALFFLVV